MTKVVRPSADTKLAAATYTKAIRYAGGREPWVVEAGNDAATGTVSSLADGAKNAFAQSSTSGLTFTIDTGEAFIDGSYVAADETSSFDVPDNATTTLKLGFNRGGPDAFRFGDDSVFAVGEPRMDMFEVTADSGSITNWTDLRTLGPPNKGPGNLTGNLPLTRIRDGDRARALEKVESGDVLKLVRHTHANESASGMTGLSFTIRDLETGSTLYTSDEATSIVGTRESPVAEISGKRMIEIAVENQTGTDPVIAGATWEYALVSDDA